MSRNGGPPYTHSFRDSPNGCGTKYAQNSPLKARILAQIYFKYNGLKISKS